MKRKIQLIMLILPLSMLFINCSSVRKNNSGYVDIKKISYSSDIKPLIENSCTPCHIPPQGKKEAFDSYEHVKENIDAIISRVRLPQDDRKFMPPVNKKPPLTDAQVAVLIEWQQQNMPE
ncbi:hypothetical protein ABS764_02960 [Flavobacterium sp. ST-87]|uniref:Cytochrome c domain-containing protein n=1 Tax=Flavobacterium plantiphilum TaxID=3163297 RepID=A0ABW8XRH9_9FLAO